MKHRIRRISLIGIITILFGLMASPVYAGKNAGAGDGVLNAIRNNPCGNFAYNAGGLHSVPVATCTGHGGSGQASINILVRGWDIEPEFPIANVPFLLGVGIDPSSAGINFQNKAVLTYANRIKFTGYKTELRLEPVVTSAKVPVNGDLVLDPSTYYNDWWNLQKMDPSFINNIEIHSASSLPGDFYTGGSDTFFFGFQGTSSSYHAIDPSTYKGEPAYRFNVTSVYLISAKASWDYYQEWEVINTVTKDVCKPGRNAAGLFDCIQDPGGLYLNGHIERVSTDIYGWGEIGGVNGGTNYVDVFIITTDKVRWPDGTIHDHIPILVYQSQPLLQKP